MAISFNPGQSAPTPGDTTGGFSSAAPTTTPNATPVDAYIPTAVPTIAVSQDPGDSSPLIFLRRNKSNFAMYFQLAIIAVFVITVGTAIGLFAYIQIIKVQVDAKKQELATLQKSFPKMPLDDMIATSARIRIANKALNEHASVATAFRLLEESISNPVTYTKFSLSRSKSKKGYNLSFAGETNSYEYLYQQIEALQSKIFSSYFTKLVFSGIGALDKKGIGGFRADTVIAIEGVYPESFTLKEKDEYLRSLLPEVASSTEGVETTQTTP
jgi:uncharacterized membrane protein